MRRKSQSVETVSLEPKGLGTRAGVGSGDLQGISILENVDSESAEELLEEGQAPEPCTSMSVIGSGRLLPNIRGYTDAP